MSDDQEVRQLKQIRRELEEIKDRTANPKRMFVNGILYGAGAFVGGILAVTAIGWVLSFLGIIPGLSHIVEYMQGLVESIPGK
jgi:hypothetical protein